MVVHPAPPVPDVVMGQHLAWGQAGLVVQAVVQGGEVHLGQVEQVVQAVEDEVGFLKIVDAVVGAHHALQREAQAVGRWVAQAEQAFGV